MYATGCSRRCLAPWCCWMPAPVLAPGAEGTSGMQSSPVSACGRFWFPSTARVGAARPLRDGRGWRRHAAAPSPSPAARRGGGRCHRTWSRPRWWPAPWQNPRWRCRLRCLLLPCTTRIDAAHGSRCSWARLPKWVCARLLRRRAGERERSQLRRPPRRAACRASTTPCRAAAASCGSVCACRAGGRGGWEGVGLGMLWLCRVGASSGAAESGCARRSDAGLSAAGERRRGAGHPL